MEAWEHKILAEKLDSLQGLPEDYRPDLNSKWDLIASGLPAAKTRRRKALFVMAAALLIGCLVSVGLLFPGRKQMAIVPVPPALPAVEKPSPGVQPEPVVQAPRRQSTQKRKQEEVLPRKKDSGPMGRDLSLRLQNEPPAVDTPALHTLPPVAEVLPQTAVAKKKLRTYQRDFESPLAEPVLPAPRTVGRTNRVRLNIFRDPEPPPAADPILQLKEHF